MANETVLFKRGDSATITSTPVTDGQILFDTSGNGKMYLDNGTDRLEMGGAITVDASLSKTSTNAIQNKAVTGNILNSLAEVSAATQQNTIAGALALKEVNSSLTADNAQQFQFAYDSESGKYGYKAKVEGADTFFPFNATTTGFSIKILPINSFDSYHFYNNRKFKTVKISFSSSNSSSSVKIYKDDVLYGTYKYNSSSITLDIADVDTLRFVGNQLKVTLEF